jgi:hypothetical protein
MPEPVLRAELAAGYARPYARWLPLALRANAVPQQLAVTAALAVAAIVAALATDGALVTVLTAFAVLAAAVTAVWAVWTTLVGVQVIHGRIRDWRPRGGELERVRARRGHAGEADRELAHDEFAVSVDDAGDLVTWRFTPLAYDAAPPRDAELLPGTPCYAAREVGRTPFDPEDAAHAAEQLADAQDAAARREAAAAGEARRALVAQERAAELEREARSTAQALRRHTGQ